MDMNTGPGCSVAHQKDEVKVEVEVEVEGAAVHCVFAWLIVTQDIPAPPRHGGNCVAAAAARANCTLHGMQLGRCSQSSVQASFEPLSSLFRAGVSLMLTKKGAFGVVQCGVDAAVGSHPHGVGQLTSHTVPTLLACGTKLRL